MADKPQVVKLAQAGIDVRTAGDEHLVYNSNWPLLKIYKQGSFLSHDATTSPQLIFNHNLGYVPMFWWFANHSIHAWTNRLDSTIEQRSEFNGPVIAFPKASASQFAMSFVPPFAQNPTKLYYYIFALDITTAYTAPKIKSGGVIGPRNKQTVFKLAKPNTDVHSSNLEDYVVNSQARSPLIHAVYPGTVAADASINGGFGFTYYHNLGYVPLFFAYGLASPTLPDLPANDFPGYELLTPDGTGASGFTIDEQKIQYFDSNVGRKISLVVLKDPFEIDNTIGVTV